MNVLIWARVSSREQREGYSIDAQLRATRDKATQEGWRVVKEFAVAESAKRGADRAIFRQMLRWVKKNAGKDSIGAILSHKLDRVCRNMRDAVRLQELEDECGVRLCFVDNQFGKGPAGALSFNVMAAVAQYYSDNLRQEVLKGMDERVRQGWIAGHAPYGYVNVPGDRDEPVQPDSEQAPAVVRIFELYSRGDVTFKALANVLENEGHVYRTSQPRFHRTALSYILNNRFYVGEIEWHGRIYQGQHRPLIDRHTFQKCRDVLNGRNRRTGSPNLGLSGGLFRCAYCGRAITGEKIRRKLKRGGVREHVYYRCANNDPGPDHPTVRWREADLEEAIVEDLTALRMPSEEVADLFRGALRAAVEDITLEQRQQKKSLARKQKELNAMQDKLLDAYLNGVIDEEVFNRKSAELKGQQADLQKVTGWMGDIDPDRGDLALNVFEWSQQAADVWRRSNDEVRRDILEAVSLNRTLTNVTLCTEKRKPFDALAEKLVLQDGRGGRIRTADLCVPNAAL